MMFEQSIPAAFVIACLAAALLGGCTPVGFTVDGSGIAVLERHHEPVVLDFGE
jgi:hypothetical protein